MDAFRTKLAEHGGVGYGLNVIAAPAAYDDAPDLIEGLTAAIVEGYRGGCADRPAATRVFLDLFPGQDARYVEASWARVCALLGDEIGNHTAGGWQTTIDLYDDAGLLAPAPVDRGGPRAPPPASDNLRRVRT